ncbi:hypothetical protein NP493_483g01017 [Ridgeia piscesae]|uniref:WD repeat-containing protein 63 n=1 Tax=Ridgeia piscesae TaxID=27915 RepID=A0AAD9KYA5_RIDPI|nr:hypothetical protein NP493_483g01017 [Ridgeia piscesae]
MGCVPYEDVTEESPFKLLKKEDILADMYNRAAISDFSPMKEVFNAYPGEEMLICYDAEYKFGQNFYIATTEEAKEKLLRGPVVAGEEGEEHVAAEEEEEVIHKYEPPVSKPWVSLGSEEAVQYESLRNNRPLVQMVLTRQRKEFGAPINLKDRKIDKTKEPYKECASYEDPAFVLNRVEMDTSVQAVPALTTSSTQTDWRFPRNANTQYYPREFTEEEQQNLLATPELRHFMSYVTPRFELALQQNEITDVFFDDWMNLGEDDGTFGTKADNHLKEYQSFTDLQFSKSKTVTHIDWHPTINGIVAVAVAEKYLLDERIDHAAHIIMTPSLVLIWSFADPIHPQLLLEAPDDIQVFSFCPMNNDIIAGGCINGQVVLWDIATHAERLRAPRGGGNQKSQMALAGFETENTHETPVVRYCAVSSIDHSHKAPVADLQWLPDHMEVNRLGVPQENRNGENVQLMTCATDNCVLFWDLRPSKTQVGTTHKEKEDKPQPLGVPATFKHLDLTWKPLLRVFLSKTEAGGNHAPCRFAIQEKHGDRGALSKLSEEKIDKSAPSAMGGGFGISSGPTKPSSAAKRPLAGVTTNFYVGTEDGEIVYADWMPQKDQESGKMQTPKPSWYHTFHDGPIVTLQRSPFFKDIILCVGGWTFSIWKEGLTCGPILMSAASMKRMTCGRWSPSRPAVFYIGKQDGSVDVWDLLDRTHEPSMNQNVTQASITAIFPFAVTAKQHLLGIGDDHGTLHILEIPWSLRKPTHNELNGVSNYFEREVKRREFVLHRWEIREKEKMELEAEANRKAGIAPQISMTEEERDYRNKSEYNTFLGEEAVFLRSLGLLKDEVDEMDDV